MEQTKDEDDESNLSYIREDEQQPLNNPENQDIILNPVVKPEKDEIRVKNKIRKMKVRQMKVRRPINLQKLFPKHFIWTIAYTCYYLWNFILIFVCATVIYAAVLVHHYLKGLWPSLGDVAIEEKGLEKGAVVLFCATIIPVIKNSLSEFIGLPFASLPIDNYNFHKPGPLLTFIDCYKAFWNDVEPQRRTFLNGRIKFFSTGKAEPCKHISVGRSVMVGTDSCLTISIKAPFVNEGGFFNLFRRNVTKPLLPTVVYLTGRTYLENRPFPIGDSVVRRSKAIYIIVNYRLNVLGFSNFNLMKSPLNIGYSDFLAAMDFIWKYLDLFNGNRSEITLLAEESGATTALLTMIMKKDVKMFDKIWLIDGSSFVPNPPARSLFYQLYASKNILCNVFMTSEDIIDCLQNFSSTVLLNNTPIGWLSANDYFYYLPNFFEERQSIIEKVDPVVGNPLEIVMKAGSNIVDIPIVVMSSIDYIPYWESLQYRSNIGNLTKKELYTRTRLGLFNYQVAASQTMLHSEINLAYKEYIKFVENRSIFYQNMDKDIIPLGFEDVLRAIISDLRSVCPYTALAKYLQINGHIETGPIYRIIDGASKYTSKAMESDLPCDLNFFLQDDKSQCLSQSNDIPRDYKETLVNSFIDFINNGVISKALQMRYPQNSASKEFEDTFAFVGRLGFRTPGDREIGMLQACNVWRRGSDEYPMLKTSAKVN